MTEHKSALEAMEAGETVRIPGVAFVEAVARQRALAPTPSDMKDAIPEEFATEVVGIRGKKRTDYKGIRIKDKSGALNKTAKNMIDMHRPAAEAGKDFSERYRAGDLDAKAQQAHEVERKHAASPDVLARCAKACELEPVPVTRGRFRGREVCDETGAFNLWLDEHGKTVRIALVGTRESMRTEVYRV